MNRKSNRLLSPVFSLLLGALFATLSLPPTALAESGSAAQPGAAEIQAIREQMQELERRLQILTEELRKVK